MPVSLEARIGSMEQRSEGLIGGGEVGGGAKGSVLAAVYKLENFPRPCGAHFSLSSWARHQAGVDVGVDVSRGQVTWVQTTWGPDTDNPNPFLPTSHR